MKQRVEKAMRSVVALPPDDWHPADWDTLEAARAVFADELRVIDRRSESSARLTAERSKRARDDNRAVYTQAQGYKAVRRRSGGECEVGSPWCLGKAREVHHRAGRGFAECHHPLLLLHVCGHGNVDGCLGWLHQHGREATEQGWNIPRESVQLAELRRLLGGPGGES